MLSTEQLQRQLSSLEDLRSVVRSMKTLSAVSIRQYEAARRSLDDYYLTVELGLYVILKDLEYPPQRPLPPGEGRHASIVLGSDHGLCGRFNVDIVDYTLQRLEEVPGSREDRLLLVVGSIAAALLEEAGQLVEENFLVPGSASCITATVQQILLKIDEWREAANVHYVYLFYNRPSSSGGYHPTGVELLPINLRRFHHLKEQRWPSRRLPTFTMKRRRLLSALLQQYIFVSLFRALAESQASEHANRMSTMQNAEKNVEERFEEVTASYRRVRQSTITNQLLDVISGFEALTGETAD